MHVYSESVKQRHESHLHISLQCNAVACTGYVQPAWSVSCQVPLSEVQEVITSPNERCRITSSWKAPSDNIVSKKLFTRPSYVAKSSYIST